MEGNKKITVDGIEVEIDAANIDDWEMLEALTDFDSGNVTAITRFARMFFGESQWKRIKSELREKNGGKLPVAYVWSFVEKVFNAFNKDGDALKN